MMTQQNMNKFVEVLSSSEPVPGGGGASAYVAALGMALGAMVANLTSGKKKYAQYQEEIEKILEKTEIITKELMECMDKDAKAFEPLSKAYGLPRQTAEQTEYRDKVMEQALVAASEAPIALMEKILESVEVLKRLSVIGSRIAISDVGVGIQFAKAALNGASLNVFINTKMMKNREIAEEMNSKTEELLAKGNKIADQIYEEVLGCIK